jgi:HPt (histidine-containing phosphotransfer) domain-containing protein
MMMAVGELVLDSELDLTELLTRVEGDYELLRDIFEIFNEEFPKSYGILTDALAANDLRRVQFSAHTLKGMFASLSFVQASACARRIELMARVDQRDGLDAEVACLKHSAAAAQASLHKACLAVSW